MTLFFHKSKVIVLNYYRQMRLFYFNPDTDFDLGCKSVCYTPPKEVILLKNNLKLIQLFVACPGDMILVDNLSSSNSDILNHLIDYACQNSISILSLNEIGEWHNKIRYSEISFQPWGWNNTILREFKLLFDNVSSLPKDEYITYIKHLAHRRTSLKIRKIISESDKQFKFGESMEMMEHEEIMRFIDNNPGAYIKLPWSSSGRGVLATARFYRNQSFEWVRGALRRQGSVIVEQEFPNDMDFASEWYIKEGKASFIGWSVFSTSNKGQYAGNIVKDNQNLEQFIFSQTDVNPQHLLNLQKTALEKVACEYNGPVGIDMMRSPAGDIHACVEVNFRYTMGHIALAAASDNIKKELFINMMSSLTQ